MEQPNAAHAQKADLEVTGVSRSGRVRKKSSKLMDFQSPDEIETRTKKGAPARHPNAAKNHQHHRQSSPSISSPTYGQNVGNPDHNKQDDEDLLQAMDFEEEHGSEEQLDSEDEEMDDLVEVGDNDESAETYGDPTVRRSIYMSEKSNKKKVMKDGKMVYGKAQRKDKGKTRFTAYMLWARDARKQMLAQQPDLDFGSISRRLGEMWANVPTNEKLNWKRRLKRFISKPKAADKKDTANTSSKFLNKGQNAGNNMFVTHSSLKTSTHSGNMGTKTVSIATTTTITNTSRTKKQSQSEYSNADNDMSADHSPLPNKKSNNQPNNSRANSFPGLYKVTGIEAVDVAAHLKLLGDSLTIIGQRLKEHEGQITVSGSLSVLLDSLLCSLGPLMCLTTQIPGFSERNEHLRDTLHNTLDNIAYVMPGL